MKAYLLKSTLISMVCLTFTVMCSSQKNISTNLVHISFFISDVKLMENKFIDHTGESISMSCEVLYSFKDSCANAFSFDIDSVVENKKELIGTCYESHNGYDSYLELTYNDKTQRKIFFYCKDYSKAVFSDSERQLLIYFSAIFEKRLKQIASNIRGKISPCINIKK